MEVSLCQGEQIDLLCLPLVNDWMLMAFTSASASSASVSAGPAAPIQPVKSEEDKQCGYGRLLTLEYPISIEEAISLVKSHFNLPYGNWRPD